MFIQLHPLRLASAAHLPIAKSGIKNGCATNPDWPGYHNDNQEISGAEGAGLRGGSWQSPAARLQVSDRENVNQAPAKRLAETGWRGVRDAP